MPSLSDLIQATVCHVADVDGAGRTLIRTNGSGSMQVVELSPSGDLRVVTAGDEPVASARYLGLRRQVLLERDVGGNERFQIMLGELDGGDGPAALAPVIDDPAHVHRIAGVSGDGSLLAYSSNRRNSVDFDFFVRFVDSGREWCVYEGGGWCEGRELSPDGRWLVIARPGTQALDERLLLIEVGEAGAPHPPVEMLEHADAAVFGTPQWRPDSSGFFVTGNPGRDLAAVLRYDLTAMAAAVVLDPGWDCFCFLSRDGSTLLVVANEDGATVGRLHDAGSLALLETVSPIEAGVLAWAYGLAPPRLADDGSAVTYTLTSPREPGDVWRHHRRGIRSRLTTTGLPARDALVVPSRHRLVSFDGESIPLLLYPPAAGAERPPAVVWVHGGPEAQSALLFSPVIQALSQSGYAVVVPNVRGSTGYGKRYASLDDGRRRLDSVRDLASVHAGLERLGADPGRAALMGGSYGGYMTLAGLAFQPDLWAAGVDIVGISSLVTFLRNTAGYRRAHREREYGSLDHDLEFLESASPLNHLARIRAPLLAIHGANDPRVPVEETRQMVAGLQQRGVVARILVYPDEGHGLLKRRNQLDAYGQVLAFLDEFLRPG